LVPNAQDVAQPSLAEPDRIDFNALGNAQWGVITGCRVSVSGSTATTTPGTALVNGVLVDVPGGQNVRVGAGGNQDRFDIVGCDNTGKLVTVPGSPSADPVFADPPTTVTMFAAVLCTAGGGDYSGNVIDKRVMLADSLKTKISPTSDLVVNANGSGNLYKVGGDGTTSWNDDVTIQRYDVGILQVSDSLRVDSTVTAGTNVVAGGSVTAAQRVTGTNLRNGTALPDVATSNPGDFFASSANGKAYLSQNGNWEEIATLKSSVPTGVVITSLQPPSYMSPLGWVPLDGSIVTEADVPALFTIPALQQYISGSSPRVMTLPDARKRVLLYSPDDIGRLGGQTAFSLPPSAIPTHNHNVRLQTGGGANPQVHVAQTAAHVHAVTGGAHPHDVSDPGHAHYGADYLTGGGFIVAAMGGQNKIDALFNDRSHTYSVEMALWTRKAFSGVQVTAGNSDHQHNVSSSGAHDHQATVDAIPGHVHNVLQDNVGLGAAVPFTPAYLAVYTYVRS
jgi:microcystin-dependent protein